MNEPTIKLLPLYAGWDWYQGLLVQAIRPLSTDQLTLRASPELRAIWELAAHIVAARARIFHGVLGAGGPELTPLQAWDRGGQPVRSADELVHGLDVTWRLIEACLHEWTLPMLNDTVTTSDGAAFTRQRMIWWGIQHDHHHGGEIFLTLGLHALSTPEFDL